jgi:hypothetical protein
MIENVVIAAGAVVFLIVLLVMYIVNRRPVLPVPPNPYAVAARQQEANLETAIAAIVLANADRDR